MDIEQWVRDGAEGCENSGRTRTPWWKPQRGGADALMERASERTTVVEARGHGKIVERIATLLLSQEVRGLYERLWRRRWNITEVQRSLFDGF
jgi:hypothetical protein